MSPEPNELPALPEPADAGALGPIARAYVDQTRLWLRAWHDSGASGMAVVEQYTASIDRLVAFLFAAATLSYRRRYVQLDQRCAVLAQGGYGRGELNPCSDLDLLVLHPHKVTPYVETITEKVLYALWDARLQVGHAVRSVRECVRLASTDLTIKTSLIDARFICGERPLGDEFERAREREIMSRGVRRFVTEKLRESERRQHAYGDSVYLLEPHLKEGQGGLRDLHTALWVAKVKYKVSSLRELAKKSVISPSELAEIEEARDFLFRVRNGLHFLAGAHQDQLSFEVQETIAQNLGYRSPPGDQLKPVEHFLRDYYLHAMAVTRFLEKMAVRVNDSPRPQRLLGRVTARTIRPGVRIVAGELLIQDSDFFSRDPVELVKVLGDAQRHGVRISAGLAEMLRQNASLLEGVREDPRIAQAFLGILKHPHAVYETLHEMHRLGLLGVLIPEFAHLLCLVLHDHYHIYTVDEHSLRGIRELEKLRSGDRAQGVPLLTQVMREVDRVELLYLGMMLHDAGKGLGGGHSEKGADFARRVALRLGLHDDDVKEVEFLVRHHLVLSHLSQRRDIHDDKLTIEVARLVGSPESLRRLYLLTYADMRATGPKVWNNWKDMLLSEAYLRVQEVFARGFEPEDRAERVARIRERVVAEVRRVGGESAAAEMAAFAVHMPDIYFLTTPEAQIPAHAQLVRRASREGLATSVVHNPACEFSEFTVATHDRPGLFALLTGVLAARGLDILAARIATSEDGIALDAFRVAHRGQPEVAMSEERWGRTRDLLADVLAGRTHLPTVLAQVGRPGVLDRKPTTRIATEIVVDNHASDEYTVIDVYAQDRLGLLHRLAQALFELGLEIHLAKITTNVDQVLDVFYVTEAEGGKSGREGEIREKLAAALSEPRETEETPRSAAVGS